MDQDKKVITVSRILAHSTVRTLLSGSANRVQVFHLILLVRVVNFFEVLELA